MFHLCSIQGQEKGEIALLTSWSMQVQVYSFVWQTRAAASFHIAEYIGKAIKKHPLQTIFKIYHCDAIRMPRFLVHFKSCIRENKHKKTGLLVSIIQHKQNVKTAAFTERMNIISPKLSCKTLCYNLPEAFRNLLRSIWHKSCCCYPHWPGCSCLSTRSVFNSVTNRTYLPAR